MPFIVMKSINLEFAENKTTLEFLSKSTLQFHRKPQFNFIGNHSSIS